ncbi:hypothetical protein H6G89_10100 [Oscillatoria sp. FACHB-1407]|uniref:hypothetical protein n=1 Tax=Oscillatoria sp. FACHB-1407 TaxID=2692847 RepID=UPI0016845220|nr:hypothetical protein [Oscillatoria sp. FACHB-1407]MBD2461399.1 hypothetical protein [Oscillatoria sp. FACHB-1407]
MINLISNAIATLSSFLRKLQVKQLLSVVLVGIVLLTVSADPSHGDRKQNRGLDKRVSDTAHQIDSERPKTMGEWEREARQTEDNVGDRVENIVEESGQALKEWGGLYPDTAKRSGRQLENQTGRD